MIWIYCLNKVYKYNLPFSKMSWSSSSFTSEAVSSAAAEAPKSSVKTQQSKLEKVALDGSVECCAPPPRWRDLELWPFDQKRNQVISVPRYTSDKSLVEIRQQILEISRKHKTTTWIMDARTDARTTRKHIASAAGAYRRRRLKNGNENHCM